MAHFYRQKGAEYLNAAAIWPRNTTFGLIIIFELDMPIDIICAIVIAYGFYVGFTRGIIKTIFSLISILFGAVATIKFGPAMTDFLQSTFNYYSGLMFIAGMALTFTLTMIIIRTLASGLESLLESANINIINQFFGGILLAFIMVSMYSSLVLFADRSHIITEEAKQTSVTYSMLIELPEMIWKNGRKLGPVIGEFWDYSMNLMDRIEQANQVERNEVNTVYDIEEDEDEDDRYRTRRER